MFAASRIERYLRDHPDGDLLIAVGYATAAGMAWLAHRTEGRRVSLLIGDARATYWKKMTDDDRAAARRFLSRRDVEVHNWYRTDRANEGRSEAHLKEWLVHDQDRAVAALVGSANLTKSGLFQNVESMVEPAATEIPGIWRKTHTLWGKSWDVKNRLLRYLDGDFASTRPDHKTGRLDGPEPPAPPPPNHATASARRPPTTTPRHPTTADHARRPQPPPSPRPTPDQERALSLDGSQAKNPVRILAVVGLVAAIGNDVALALVLRALGFSEFFSSWALPAFFVCCSLAVGGMCYWAATRAEGADRGLAIAGVAAAAIPLVAGLVALVAALVVLAITVLAVLLVLVVLATLSNR